jgi:hypothetical protein
MFLKSIYLMTKSTFPFARPRNERGRKKKKKRSANLLFETSPCENPPVSAIMTRQDPEQGSHEAGQKK